MALYPLPSPGPAPPYQHGWIGISTKLLFYDLDFLTQTKYCSNSSASHSPSVTRNKKKCKNILTVNLLFTPAHHITVVIWTKTMIHRHSHQQPATAAHQISSEEVSAQCTGGDNGSAGHPHHPHHRTCTYSSYQWSMGKLNWKPKRQPLHYQILMQIFNITRSTLCILCLYVWSIVLYRSTHFKRWIHAAWGQSVLDFRILEHQHSNG